MTKRQRIEKMAADLLREIGGSSRAVDENCRFCIRVGTHRSPGGGDCYHIERVWMNGQFVHICTVCERGMRRRTRDLAADFLVRNDVDVSGWPPGMHGRFQELIGDVAPMFVAQWAAERLVGHRGRNSKYRIKEAP